MKYIDLTQTFTSEMPVYPGDAHSELVLSVDNGIVQHELKTGTHVGTHMDGPLHMIAGGKYLTDYPAEKFFGRGVVVDARGKEVADENLLTGVEIKEGDIVLVCFGWGGKFRDADYYKKYPELSMGLAKKLVELGVSIVGMDTPSPDRSPYEVHKILLSKDVLIVENLINIEGLIGKNNFEIAALPAKFHAEAAPCRVVASFSA